MTLSTSVRAKRVLWFLLSIVVLLPLVMRAAYAEPYRPIDSRYKLVFEDTFSGPSLDLRKWTPNWLYGECPHCVTPPQQPKVELAAYDPKQVMVRNGYAAIKLDNRPSVTVYGTHYPYSSGMIQTSSKAEFVYGYFEARIYLPASLTTGGIANWPGFTLNGHNWPYDGENDILEGLGPKTGVACYHFHYATGQPGACPKMKMTGWHTYGSLWQKGKISYYYDGRYVGSIAQGVTSKPMYMILNYGVGPKFGGPTRLSTTMYVDYARVWQRR